MPENRSYGKTTFADWFGPSPEPAQGQLQMLIRPRLLDLFCGAGGAAMGYHRAGFDVVGVDIKPQARYPFAFHQADALTFPLDGFDAVHASPPCQAYTDLRHRTGGAYPDLIDKVRLRLISAGLPYVIENVKGAPLINPIRLCGSSLGLGANGRQLRRHRLFECSFPVMVSPCQHRGQPVGVYGTGGGGQMTRGYRGTPDEYREAMGIPWATRAEIAQAIPPAYTEHVGRYLMAELAPRAAPRNRITPPSPTPHNPRPPPRTRSPRP